MYLPPFLKPKPKPKPGRFGLTYAVAQGVESTKLPRHRGAVSSEYAVLLAMISITLVTAVVAFGNGLGGTISGAGAAIGVQ